MTDAEFDLLDELYFAKSYNQLVSIFDGQGFDLDQLLLELFDKNWIKALDLADNEIPLTPELFHQNKGKYRFTATKKGLMAHNQR